MSEEIKGKILPEGYIQCVSRMLDMLKTKKLVALFNNLQDAENDCLFELCNHNKDNEDAVKMIWSHYKEMVDLQEWFDDLGK